MKPPIPDANLYDVQAAQPLGAIALAGWISSAPLSARGAGFLEGNPF